MGRLTNLPMPDRRMIGNRLLLAQSVKNGNDKPQRFRIDVRRGGESDGMGRTPWRTEKDDVNLLPFASLHE